MKKTGEGYFGNYGGSYLPQELNSPIVELEQAYFQFQKDSAFQKTLSEYLDHFVGRPSPLYPAKNLVSGAKIFLKREDLNHTGSHKINNALGQALLAKKMGKKRIVAETGAGQHGVATATACSFLRIECVIYMGAKDMQRQKMNVHRIKLLGAEIKPVKTGTQTLKDAVDAALADYSKNFSTSFYLLGSAVGPHPYPTMVRDFQSIIGRETKKQILERKGRLPDYLIACVGGGSNAIGLFHPFLQDETVKKIGVEPGGKGLETKEHAATINKGKPGIIHGFKSYTLQDQAGEPLPVHSIAAGLDYPGVGPEHSMLFENGKVTYHTITDKEALEAFKVLSKKEGIIPALESAHAVAYTLKIAPLLSSEQIIVVNLSGRGDKDVNQVMDLV